MTDYDVIRRGDHDIKPNLPEETSDDEETNTQIPTRSQARMLDAQQASRYVRILRLEMTRESKNRSSKPFVMLNPSTTIKKDCCTSY